MHVFRKQTFKQYKSGKNHKKIQRNYHRERAAAQLARFLSLGVAGEIASRDLYAHPAIFERARSVGERPGRRPSRSDRTPHLKDKYNFMVLLHTNCLHSLHF